MKQRQVVPRTFLSIKITGLNNSQNSAAKCHKFAVTSYSPFNLTRQISRIPFGTFNDWHRQVLCLRTLYQLIKVFQHIVLRLSSSFLLKSFPTQTTKRIKWEPHPNTVEYSMSKIQVKGLTDKLITLWNSSVQFYPLFRYMRLTSILAAHLFLSV